MRGTAKERTANATEKIITFVFMRSTSRDLNATSMFFQSGAVSVDLTPLLSLLELVLTPNGVSAGIGE